MNVAIQIEAAASQMAERIERRLAEIGKSARAVSLAAGLSADGIRIILDGRSQSPGVWTVAALAKELQCTTGWLIGEAGAPEPEPVDTFADRVRKRMETKGSNPYRLAKDAGVGDDYVRNVLRGNVVEPGLSKVVQLAKALDCTLYDLAGIPNP